MNEPIVVMADLRTFLVNLADALDSPDNNGKLLSQAVVDSLRVAIDKTWRIADGAAES